MPVTKPTNLGRWATDGTAPITEPAEGKKDVGWAVDEKPAAQYFNWFWNIAYKWFTYLDDLSNQVWTWTAAHTFLPSTTTPAINVTANASGSAGHGIATVSSAAAYGISANTSTTVGAIHVNTGGSGPGVFATTTGTGPGLFSQAGTSGYAAYLVASATKAGLVAVPSSAQPGISALADVGSGGHGIQTSSSSGAYGLSALTSTATGAIHAATSGSGPGVFATTTGSGPAVRGEAGASGLGGYFTASATQPALTAVPSSVQAGLVVTAGAGATGHGVSTVSSSSAYGIQASSGTSLAAAYFANTSGVVGRPAVTVGTGGVFLNDTTISGAKSRTITKLNCTHARVLIGLSSSASPTINAAYNIDHVSADGTGVNVSFLAGATMANANYEIQLTMESDASSLYFYTGQVVERTTAGFTFAVWQIATTVGISRVSPNSVSGIHCHVTVIGEGV